MLFSLSPRCGERERTHRRRSGPWFETAAARPRGGLLTMRNGDRYFPDFGSATIMSSSTRAPGEESWLMQIIVLAGIQSPK